MNLALLANSFYVGSLATLLAVSFGFATALWVAGLSPRGRGLVVGLAVISLCLPPFVVTNCWLHYLGAAGTWHAWLPLNVASLTGAAWILGLMLWPIPLLLVLAAWNRLEPAQLESDMAVTGVSLVRVLLWPLGRAAMLQAGLITLVLALNNFAVPSILAVTVFPAEMWIRFNTTFDTLGALSLAWPLVLGPLALLAWLARRQVPWPHLQNPVSPRLLRQQLGGGLWTAAGVVAVVICLLSAGLPLLEIAVARRTWVELPGAFAAGQGAAWNSFLFALAAATLVMFVALGRLLLSRKIGRRSVLSGRPGLGTLVLWMVFLLPGVLLGIALIHLFNRPWSAVLYQSAGIVVLAFVLRYLVVGMQSVAHASQTADPDLLDSARLEGANGWQMFRHVYWPQLGGQFSAAWYAVFLLCLWDVESMILVVPPGGETLALRIFNLLHYGHSAQVNALCLVLLVIAVLPLGMLVAARWLRLVPVFGLTLAVSSCAPPSTPDSAPLQSQFFSAVRVFGSRGVGVGQLNKPRSVAVDCQDNFYAVDMTGRVQKFSPEGTFLLSWQMPQTSLGKPKGMCRDAQGNIVVVEPHYARVNHYSTEGKLVAQWGVRGTNDGQFAFPRAVAVNSRGEIVVSEYQLVERVQEFAPAVFTGGPPTNNCVRGFGKAGNAPGEFNRPEGVCVDGQDRIYVADSCNHRIEIFSSDGKLLRTYGKPGQGRGELSYPYDICVDAAGNQFVCEFGNSRIQVFDAQDRPVEIIGGPGTGLGRFANPWGVALDSQGNLYVADALNHRVQKLLRRQNAGNSKIATRNSKEIRNSKLEIQSQAASASLGGSAGFQPALRIRSRTLIRNVAARRGGAKRLGVRRPYAALLPRAKSIPGPSWVSCLGLESGRRLPHSKTLREADCQDANGAWRSRESCQPCQEKPQVNVGLFRTSVFEFPSSFGFRISDLPLA